MKKPNKELQMIIHDLIKNHTISNNDLINEREEIVNHIKTIYQQIDILTEEKEKLFLEELNLYLDLRIVIPCPNYTTKEIENLSMSIKKLKKIPQPEQRTEEWYNFRNNRLTASDLATAIRKNPYSNKNKLILNKCGISEPWNPGPAIIHGVKFEDVAVSIYEKRNNVIIYEYGCLPHPELECFGASPDGICDPKSHNKNYIGRMLEIKCPSKRPITGFIPEYYHYQVQGQLEVCNLNYCDFLECKITEISKEEYYKLGNIEKGVVVELHDDDLGKMIYKYSELCICPSKIDDWEETIIDTIFSSNMSYIKTTYWKLSDYNCLLIARDKKLWSDVEPEIISFWKEVEKYRLEGHEELLPKKKKGRKGKFKEKDTFTFLN
jgi:putative phage-type endonuclease